MGKFGLLVAGLTCLALAYVVRVVMLPSHPANPRDDALFKVFDYVGKQQTQSGPLSVPFHCYHSRSMQIHGTFDLATVRSILKDTGYFPVESVESTPRAVGYFWVVEYVDSTGGPYLETLFHFFVTETAGYRVTLDSPLALNELMFFAPDVKSYVWRLWLNQKAPIDYGREILSYDKYFTSSSAFIRTNTNGVPTDWHFPSAGDKTVLMSGHFEPKSGFRQSLYELSVVGDLVPRLGLRNAGKLLCSDYLSAPAVSWKHVCPAYTSSEQPRSWVHLKLGEVLFYPWDHTTDSLTFHEADVKALKFEPMSVQVEPRLKFVLTPPDNANAN
jgi:hypothetical protein